MGDLKEIASFDEPPVNETVLAVGFASLAGMGAAHFSRFQQAHLPNYSEAEELPAYNMPIERLSGGNAGISFALSQGIPPTRTAFVDPAGDRLFQIQRDWFGHNWRRTGDSQYPRYPDLKRSFLEGWKEFGDWAAGEAGRPPLEVAQAEVTYINHLPALEVDGKKTKAPARLLRLFSVAQLGEGVQELESVNLSTSALFTDQNGLPVGRLHISFGPSQTREGDAVNILNLTARGAPEMGLSKFFDAARAAIVTTFVQLTDTELHTQWGRNDDD